MAIDTRQKRASCYMLAVPFGRVFPQADNTISQADRTQLNLLYSGILSGITVPETLTADTLTFNLYVHQTPALTMYAETARAANLYVEQSRSINLER